MVRQRIRILFLALMVLVLNACTNGANTLQQQAPEGTPVTEVIGTYTVESYPFHPAANINFGSGFSTPSERFLGAGKCLEFGSGQSSLEDILQYEPSALKLEFDMDLATSRAELSDKLDLSAGIKARIGVVNIEGSARVLFDDETTSNDVYLVAKGKATGHSFGVLALGQNNINIQGYNFEEPEKSTGFGKLFREDYKTFLERCGDRFVSSITLGGEFYLIAQIETYSQEHKQDIEGSLRVEIASIGAGGSASLKKVLDKARAETNMKVHLLSSGMFPSAQTLLNVQSDPGAVITDLIDGINSQCLSVQEKVEQASINVHGLRTLNAGESLPYSSIQPQAIDNFNTVLEHLSICSKTVTLSDYKILTTEDSGSAVAIKALNSHFTASRLMDLLASLESFAINANYYAENDFLFEVAQENPPAGQQATKTAENMIRFVKNDVANLRFALKEQLAKCQAGQFDDCAQVSVAGFGEANDDDYKTLQDELDKWNTFIPSRGKFELPNTCNTLKDVRGTREFSSSLPYTIYFQRILARGYKVYCQPKADADEVTLIGTPDDNRPDATSYFEYVQLKNPQNLSRGATHASAVNLGAFDQTTGSVEQATRYDRIRINPIDLTLEPEDLTYTYTVGQIKPLTADAQRVYEQMPKVTGQTVRAMPLGTAIGCNNTPAQAMVNLEGTGLFFDPLMSERGAWLYTAFGDVKEPPRIRVTKQSISIDSGFSEDCVQLRPADFRIKLSLPIDATVLDEPGLYSDEVAFSQNPVQSFVLSNNPTDAHQFWVDDYYDMYLDGFQIGRSSNGWTAPFNFRGRQGQTLNLIATNTGGPCGLGTLYVLLLDDERNVIGSQLIYEAEQHQHGGTAKNGKYDRVDCSNGVANARGVFFQHTVVIDFPDITPSE